MPNPVSWHIEPLLPPPAGIADAGTVSLTFAPSASEVYTTPILDAGTASLVFTLSASEIYARTSLDTNTTRLGLVASSSEVQTGSRTDATTARVSFVPSGSDSLAASGDGSIVIASLVPSAIEFKGITIVDAATAFVDLQVDSHECYQRATPTYQVDIFRRWNMSAMNNRWDINVQQRWGVDMLVGALVIRC